MKTWAQALETRSYVMTASNGAIQTGISFSSDKSAKKSVEEKSRMTLKKPIFYPHFFGSLCCIALIIYGMRFLQGTNGQAGTGNSRSFRENLGRIERRAFSPAYIGEIRGARFFFDFESRKNLGWFTEST